jgi:hypothetical protein
MTEQYIIKMYIIVKNHFLLKITCVFTVVGKGFYILFLKEMQNGRRDARFKWSRITNLEDDWYQSTLKSVLCAEEMYN